MTRDRRTRSPRERNKEKEKERKREREREGEIFFQVQHASNGFHRIYLTDAAADPQTRVGLLDF